MEQVRRDRWGIPFLRAESVLDLARLQGRVMATDRTWQLVRDRARAEGRSAELLGDSAVAWDALARRAQLARTARTAYDALPDEDRAFVAAFADGVSEGLAERPRCAELDLLAEPATYTPEPWHPWTPLAVHLGNHLLFGTYPDKLWAHHVRRTLGEEALDLLCEEGPPTGSNAIVFGGDRTASGRPMVVGDPHRDFEMPNVYAQVGLACPEFDVVGLCFPGVPGVQHFGHAGSVAWAVTNAAADSQDLYVERLRRGDPEGGATGDVEARGPDGWEPVRRHSEEIVVRGGEPVTVECLETGRGPVVVGGPDDAEDPRDPESFSLRTPAWDRGDVGFAALLPLLRARTAADVDAAVSRWVLPVNNWMVADSSGAVLHRVAGVVPRRDRSCFGEPVPATDGVTWNGVVEPLPRRVGDAGSALVTANERGTPDYAAIGDGFSPPWRADRIAELIGDRTGFTAESAAAVLLDVRQTAGGPLLDLLGSLDGLGDLGRLGRLEPAGAALRDRLLAWDREMAVDSVEARLFVAVRETLVARIADALPGLGGGSPYGAEYAAWFALPSRITAALPSLLAADRPFGLDLAQLLAAAVDEVAAGVDGVATGVDGVATGADQPASGVAAGADGPAAGVVGVAAGTWGARHLFAPRPTPAGGLEGRWPLPGDTRCVRAAASAYGGDGCPTGSVARYVWDLADRSASRWVLPLGATAEGPHAADQLPEWAAGRLVPVGDWGRRNR